MLFWRVILIHWSRGLMNWNIFTSWAKLRSFEIFFLPQFSNLQISTVLTTIFPHRIDGLLIKYDMIIFLSGILSGVQVSRFSGFFRIFSNFLQILIFLFEVKVYSAHELGILDLSLVKCFFFLISIHLFFLYFVSCIFLHLHSNHIEIICWDVNL